MRFFTGRHRYYCGIDLHARTMYLCILEHDSGEIVLHRNLRTEPARFLRAIGPYRDDLVVGAECIFCWYWLADLCAAEDIAFVLGHALYMKAIHGGKAKNDRIDARHRPNSGWRPSLGQQRLRQTALHKSRAHRPPSG